jgi:hypothetical protein
LLASSDSGSGVAATYYQLDGAAAQAYDPAGITISAVGAHMVRFWASDNAGNVEAHADDAHVVSVSIASPATPPVNGVELHAYNARYWVDAPSLSTVVPTINYASYSNTTFPYPALWTNGSPGPLIQNHDFSTAFTGQLNVTTAGTYTFLAYTDDDGFLYIDDQLVSDDSGAHAWMPANQPAGYPTSTPVYLNSGPHSVIFLQNQALSGSAAILVWNGADSGYSNAAVPSSALTPVSPAPADPTDLSARALTTTSIQLNWQDHATDATYYVVERSIDGGNFVPIATLGAMSGSRAEASPTTFTDATVLPGTQYRYRVRAGNFDGSSGDATQVAPVNPSSAAVLTLTSVSAPAAVSDQPFSNVVVARFTNSDPTVTPGGMSAVIDWGDGTSTPGSITANPDGSFSVLGSHTYSGAPLHTMNVTVSNGSGATATSSTYVSVKPAPGHAHFDQGFMEDLTLNAKAGDTLPVFRNGGLVLTDGRNDEARSAFTSDKVEITHFTTTFDFQQGPVYKLQKFFSEDGKYSWWEVAPYGADGITFTIQGAAPTALGSGGGGLAYSGIPDSAAVIFDLYHGATHRYPIVAHDQTGLLTGGIVGESGRVDMGGGFLHSADGVYDGAMAHVMHAMIDYDGSVLVEEVTDTVTGATFRTVYSLPDLPALVGGNTAYVGFTAATGGASSSQTILNWTWNGGLIPTWTFAQDASATFGQSTVQLQAVVAALDGSEPVNEGVMTFNVYKTSADGTATVAGTMTASVSLGGLASVNFPVAGLEPGTYKFTALYSDGGPHPSFASSAPGDTDLIGTLTINAMDLDVHLPTVVQGQALQNVRLTQFSDSDPTATAGSFHATIDWGDGASGPGSVVSNLDGTYAVLGSHTYASAADGLVVRVTVSDASAVVGSGAASVPHSPPGGALSDAPNVAAAAGGYYFFKVTYTGTVPIDYRTIVAGSDALVTGPGGFSQAATLVNLPSPADWKVWTATYRIAAPGGSWDSADNGTYTITMLPEQVADTSGAFVAAGTLGTFVVSVADAPPTATLVEAPNVTAAGGVYTYIKVSYASASGVAYASIDGKDVLVTGPGGYSQTGLLANLTTAAGVWTATYRLTAPGNSWGPEDNGAYAVSLVAGQVAGVNGTFVPAGIIGGFTAAVPDTTAPTATLTEALDVTVPGALIYYFKVTYADNVAVAYQSIAAGNDVVVTGPGGYSALGTLANLVTSGGQWTATYRVAAPGGSWDSADSGTYAVAIRANEVSDTSGNFVAARPLGQFSVALLDTTPPTATLVEALPVGGAGEPNYFFKVRFADNLAVAYQSIAGNDVLVMGPGGYSAAGILSNLVVASGVWTATYRVTPPGGSWDAPDSGTYTVQMRAGEVSDASGNFVPAGTLGTFVVSIAPPASSSLSVAGIGTLAPLAEAQVLPVRTSALRRRTYDSVDVLTEPLS